MLMLVLVDLSTLVGERIAAITAPPTTVVESPVLQTRRAMMGRLADARAIASSDPVRAEADLIDVFAEARDPQVRTAAATQLLSLAVNDWPRGHQQSFLASVFPAALESGRLHGRRRASSSLCRTRERLGRPDSPPRITTLFGIKANAAQAGVEYPTLEASADGVQIIQQRFRSYASSDASITSTAPSCPATTATRTHARTEETGAPSWLSWLRSTRATPTTPAASARSSHATSSTAGMTWRSRV